MSPDRHARHAEARANLVVGDQDAVAVGNLDATPAVTVGGRHLRDGVAAGARGVVGLDEELDLAGLGDLLGEQHHVVSPHRLALLERHDPPAAPLPGDRGGGFGRGQQTALGQVRGVGVAGGLPHHDPDPCTAVATRRQLLDPAVVEHGGGRVAVLDEHLGEVPASAERRARARAR